MEARGPRRYGSTAGVGCLRAAFALCVVVDGGHLFFRRLLESLDWRRGLGVEQQPAEHDVQQVDGACRLDAAVSHRPASVAVQAVGALHDRV